MSKITPKPTRRDLLKSVITIKAGPESCKQNFAVHKELACHYSSFFRSATRGSWLEAQTGVVELPDDDPEIVALFQTWLYAQDLELDEGQQLGPSSLLDIFIFGDKMGAPGFQNTAIDLLSQWYMRPGFVPRANTIKSAYESTISGSPIRKLLVDIFARKIGYHKGLDIGSYPHQFLADLVQKLRPANPKRLVKINSALYHVEERKLKQGVTEA